MFDTMTVGEAIEALENFNPDTPLVLTKSDYAGFKAVGMSQYCFEEMVIDADGRDTNANGAGLDEAAGTLVIVIS